MYRIAGATLLLLIVAFQSGCMTVGYSYAKDPKALGHWAVTIITIEPQNIYNAAGVFWVGPFAKVESRGQRIKFVDAKGKTQEIVQPLSDRYVLSQGQKATFVADRGQVWVQPTDYPLPPEFGAASGAATAVPAASQPVVQSNPAGSASGSQATRADPGPSSDVDNVVAFQNACSPERGLAMFAAQVGCIKALIGQSHNPRFASSSVDAQLYLATADKLVDDVAHHKMSDAAARVELIRASVDLGKGAGSAQR